MGFGRRQIAGMRGRFLRPLRSEPGYVNSIRTHREGPGWIHVTRNNIPETEGFEARAAAPESRRRGRGRPRRHPTPVAPAADGENAASNRVSAQSLVITGTETITALQNQAITNRTAAHKLEQLAENDCTICRGEYDGPTTTRCGHVFCKACIVQWMQEERSCPACRRGHRVRDLVKVVTTGSGEGVNTPLDQEEDVATLAEGNAKRLSLASAIAMLTGMGSSDDEEIQDSEESDDEL